MKRFILFVMFFVTFVFPMAAGAGVTIMWDANDPVPDGYRVYHRWEGGTYDYAVHHWQGSEITTTITDLLPPLPDMLTPTDLGATWNKVTGNITVNWTQPADAFAENKLYLIVRAYLDAVDPAPALESADSEEVNIMQKNTNTISKWEIFYSDVSGGPYTSLGEVIQDGSAQPVITKPVVGVPVNTVKTLYFTAVAFGKGTSFSPNSAEVSVLVDRRSIAPPAGVSVSVTVPVQ